jgi:hypothetical protein
MKLLGITSVGFDIIDQLLIRFSAFIRYWRKKWDYNEIVCMRVCARARACVCVCVCVCVCARMYIYRMKDKLSLIMYILATVCDIFL